MSRPDKTKPQLGAFDAYHLDVSEIKIKLSQKWFDDKMSAMDPRKVTPRSIMSSNSGGLTANLSLGNMYAFYYMPMTAATLPYYDTFPLILPFNRTKETFYGLNLHYLNYPMRFALFKELMRISNVSNVSDNTRMKFKWETIVGMSKLAAAQDCVKQYRFDHIKSPFLKIAPNDWATAMLLPLARFVKSNQNSVWAESNKIGRSW